jgi:hypothetical protein
MINSNSVKRICWFVIFLLSITQGVSQNIQIDTIHKTILLDEKATIANGNLLKQGAELDTLYRESKVLIDSLRSEINISNLQVIEYKTVKVPTLESIVKEKDLQYKTELQKSSLIIGGLETDLKSQKTKKWTFGAVFLSLGLLLGLFL